MSGFVTPLDIWNRALQHIGSFRVSYLLELTSQANEIRYCYDKLRLAELQRNLWGFATRRTVMRALTNTMLVWTPPAWVAATTYAAGAITSYSGSYWQADQAITGSASNTAPDITTSWHRYFGPEVLDTYDSGTAYFPGDLVKSGVAFYLSLTSVNDDTPPSSNWLAVNGTTVPLTVLYPIGAGPSTQSTSRNAFRLPYGFLSRAPKDRMSNPYLGMPLSVLDDDWVVENQYIVTSDPGPVAMRFIADVTDVYDMDPMFCEGLAARIATEVAPSLVDPERLPMMLANASRHYKTEMTAARTNNAIEIGPIDPVRDTYISCRL